MKFLFIALFTIAPAAFALVCSDQGAFNNLNDISGQKCLSDDVTTLEIPLLIATESDAREHCSNCKNPTLKKILEMPDAQIEHRKSIGNAVLDEFQKEFTFIAMDLMKMRSAFKFDIDPREASKSCKIDNDYLIPKCLNKNDENVRHRIQDIKNKAATEIANILSPDDTPKAEGLFIRRPNSCNLNDTDVLFSMMRNYESLITPEFVSYLYSLKIPNKGSVSDFLDKQNLKKEFEQIYNHLKMHPIFSSLLRNPNDLNSFLKNTMALKTKEEIIEELYSSSSAKKFSSRISDRCQSLMSKTKKYLDEVYCSKEIKYSVKDLNSMEAISGMKFNHMDEKTADQELRVHCSNLEINANAVNFNKIREDINEGNTPHLTKYPINEFKTQTFIDNIQNPAELICSTMKDKNQCLIEPTSTQCRLLEEYQKSKSDKTYQSLAKGSNDNINQILRSMIGDGVPMTAEGKPNQQAITILKEEGILPGGPTTSRPPQVDAGTFHKTVRESAPSNSPTPQGVANQAGKPTFNTDPNQTTSSNSNFSSFSPSENKPQYGEENGPETTPSEPRKTKKGKKNGANSFSNLSDGEQDELLRRLKRSKKVAKNAEDPAENEEDETPTQNTNTAGALSGASIIGNGINSNSNQPSNSKPNASTAPTNRASLDPVKKQDVVNNALIDANTGRNPASGSSTPSEVSVSSKNDKEKEIKIQVSDKELSRVSEFKDKLSKLLAAHSQDLSVTEDGGKIIVKLNSYKVEVVYNQKSGLYDVHTLEGQVPKEYLSTISTYFNKTLKEGGGKREALVNTLKVSQK